MGFRTAVVENACRPFVNDLVVPSKEVLFKAGVAVMSSEEALKEVADGREYTLKEWLAHHKASKRVHKIRHDMIESVHSHAA